MEYTTTHKYHWSFFVSVVCWLAIVLYMASSNTSRFESQQPSLSFLKKKKKNQQQQQYRRSLLSSLENGTSGTTTTTKNHNNNNITSNPTKFIRFHEMNLTNIQKSVRKYHSNLRTAYDDATILEQTGSSSSSDGWFPYEQICKSTCCATAVAISLESPPPPESEQQQQQQQQYYIIHTSMGMELSDTSIPHYPNTLQFHSKPPFLTEDLIECLQPGTIIQMDNHATILNYFWRQLRPKITVPFVTITSESDGDSPDDRFSRFAHKLKHDADPLLLKWYGTNPDYQVVDKYDGQGKFVGMPLGLSRQHKQAPYLQYYLQQQHNNNRSHSHPFEDKERWISAFTTTTTNNTNNNNKEIDKWLFVNFNVHGYAQHRQVVHDKLCHPPSSFVKSDLYSCRNKTAQSTAGPEVVYAKASEYLFGMSPPGMGWDCYRTYELLLVGVIPIIDGRSRKIFEGLPVLFIDNLNDVRSPWTRASLYQQAKDYVLSDEFRTTNFTVGWNRLFTRYWRHRIMNDAGRGDEIYTDPEDGTRYFKAWRYTRRSSSSQESKKPPVYCSTLFECQSKSYIDQTPAPTTPTPVKQD